MFIFFPLMLKKMKMKTFLWIPKKCYVGSRHSA